MRDYCTTTAAGMGSLPHRMEDICGPGSIDRVLAQTNLPFDIVEDRTLRMPLESMVSLFQNAGDISDDPFFGLNVGLSTDADIFGPWFGYVTDARSLRSGLKRLAWALPLFQNGPTITLYEGDRLAAFSYFIPHFSDVDSRHHVDHALPIMLTVLRRFLGEDWLPKRIKFPYPDPGLRQRLEDRLAVDVQFDQPTLSMVFDKSDLDMPPRPECMRGEAYCCDDLRARLGQMASNLDLALEANIILEMAYCVPTVDAVAARMKLSTRSLQRRLMAQGVSFRDKLMQVRHERALGLLRDTNLDVSDIAHRLGYMESSNFTRAFKTWAGQSPSQMRQVMRRHAC